MGGGVALGRVNARGVRPDPGDAFEGRTADLPARGVEFEADGAAEFIDGQVDGARVVARGCGGLGDVTPAGGAWRAVEVFFTQGVWSCRSWSE